MNKILVVVSFFFVIFSFSPSLFELYHAHDIPKDRVFVLEHNFMFDYNFYLSRIRQGQEGRWLVAEKYYNQPHKGSLFQIFYLYLGKIGGLFGFSPPWVYHLSRLLTGLVLLILIGSYTSSFFPGWWKSIGYLLVVTAGSWPILVRVGNYWRFATYMGWWSVIDSLQRITTIPHILAGQIFLLLFIRRFGQGIRKPSSGSLVGWGALGLIAGIVFPPTLLIVYTIFGILSFFEFVRLPQDKAKIKPFLESWIKENGYPRAVFVFISGIALIYIQQMFKILPWSALALFDVQHRIPLPYKEYFLALGPMLPLGVLGGLVVILKNEKRLLPVASWVLAIFLLFRIFEGVPVQSPLRFTEGAINIPLGILAAYLFWQLWLFTYKLHKPLIYVVRGLIGVVLAGVIILGLGVMTSIIFWLTDQANARRLATWVVSTGAQLAYPLQDFMEEVRFFKNKTRVEDVVLAYETAGNFIPAYAGNYAYLGHANTPDADKKLLVAKDFFSGKMSIVEAKEFLRKERISYIFFGPQEKELGKITDLTSVYPGLNIIDRNAQVIIYKVEK